MNIIISEKAQEWFEREMDVEKNDFIRFYVRYGGSSPLHDSFSLGVNKEDPIEVAVKETIKNVTYFVEANDIWFFDGHDLHVLYDDTLDEPKYEYKK
ncbi:HesB/YadR/YfhF family protein [Rossellomorea sp. BNER]|uniref:HesB/YadR/YfhF family protein n=1 Tax=Rossellomorea sp. BNER TaxID=2962031 RepID=UPI003AF1FB0E|nr:HesB/YadR/YfhF family protein [Rossellomorea sp. BNER]